MSVASHENNRKPIFSGFFLNIIKQIVFKFQEVPVSMRFESSQND